jgi:two-component system, LuxR family, response regulator FixJ
MSPKFVHVVEDEPAIRRSTQMILKVLGYEPQTHVSGVAFLDALPELPEGCVLLDIRMPEMDGLEVQRRLKAAGADPPLVTMSGHGDLAIAVAAMEQGAMAFLEKPFRRAALEQALDIAFRRLEDPSGYRQYLESAAGAVNKLAPVDRQVLALMAQGRDVGSIADQTGLEPLSIEVSRSRIFAELGTDSLTDVLRVAFAASRAEGA